MVAITFGMRAMPVAASRGRASVEPAAEIGPSVGVGEQVVYRRWRSRMGLPTDVMDRVMEKVCFNLSEDLPDDAIAAWRDPSDAQTAALSAPAWDVVALMLGRAE